MPCQLPVLYTWRSRQALAGDRRHGGERNAMDWPDAVSPDCLGHPLERTDLRPFVIDSQHSWSGRSQNSTSPTRLLYRTSTSYLDLTGASTRHSHGPTLPLSPHGSSLLRRSMGPGWGTDRLVRCFIWREGSVNLGLVNL